MAHTQGKNAPNGKIARLPDVVRSELNRRLSMGEGGKALLDWLNSQPELNGKPKISEGNLSNWRLGGFALWAKRNPLPKCVALSQKAANFKPA